MLSDHHGGFMYPAQDNSLETVHGNALELLVQQRQQPRQQLALSGEHQLEQLALSGEHLQASFELAGPFSPEPRDVCRDSEQDTDQEIGKLLALKQQLHHRQQQEQQQVQQQGGAASTSFQLDWTPLLGRPTFGGNTSATTCRHTVHLGSLSAMSLQQTQRSSQGLSPMLNNTHLNNKYGVTSSSQAGAMQMMQGQPLGLTQAAAVGPDNPTLPGPQVSAFNTGFTDSATADGELLAARGFLQQQLRELQQQEQLLHQQELQLQLQLEPGDTLLAAAPPSVLYDNSSDVGAASSNGNAYFAPAFLQPIVQQGVSSPLLSQQMLQQQELAMQSQLYAPASGQMMAEQQQLPLLEVQNMPGCALNGSSSPMYQQLQQQQLGLPDSVTSPGQPSGWPAAAAAATSFEGLLVPGAPAYATVGSPLHQQLQLYQQQQQQQLGHANHDLLQTPPGSGSGTAATAAAAAARSPVAAHAGSSWPQAAGATPANAQAAAAAAAAAAATTASLAGVAADAARMQAADHRRHSVDLAAAVAAGPLTFSAHLPHLQGGSCSTQLLEGTALSGSALDGVQCSSQSISHSSGSYIVRTGPAAFNAAAGQRLVNSGQTQVNTGQTMVSTGATIPCTPQQLARFVDEQHYYYERASFDVPHAPHRAVISVHTAAQSRRRRSAGPAFNTRRASFGSYSSGSSMGPGLAAAAAAERERSNGRAAAAHATATSAAAGPPASRTSAGVRPDARPTQTNAAAAGNSSRSPSAPRSPAASAAAGQAAVGRDPSSTASSSATASRTTEPAGSEHAGGSSSQQLARAAAPKWAGSFWHPLAPLAKAGKKASSTGTGVFLPGGTEHLS